MKPTANGNSEEYYDEYYSDEYYDEEEDNNAPPKQPGRGPPQGPPGMSRGVPPAIPPNGRGPPPLPRAGGVPPPTPAKRRTKKESSEEYYDSYYEYEYEEEDVEDVYEYDYDEIYEYDYEYDDEPGANGPPIAYPRGQVPPVPAKEPGYGQQETSNRTQGGGPMMLDPNMLNSARGGLSKRNTEDIQPVARVPNRPFGLTSTKLSDMRGGMNKVGFDKEKTPAQQVDFRGNLKIASSHRAKEDGKPKAVPPWMNPNLKKGARPMTTNLQRDNTARIRAQVQAAKDKSRNRPKAGPTFMNGVPVAPANVRMNRMRPKNDNGIDTSVLSSGVVKEVQILKREQDANNPHRFLTKNRVSVKIKKKVERPPGMGKESVRIKKRVPSTKFKRGQSTRAKKGGVSRRIKRGESSRMKKGGESSRMKKGGESRRIKRGESARIKRGESSRMRKGGESRRVKRGQSSRMKGKEGDRVTRRSTSKEGGQRRRRNPNVSRTSVNHNIFGAKTKPVDEGQGIGLGDGCYLKFDSNNGGILYAQWTVVGFEPDDALAFFKPKTPVPRFKYRRNEGREDLLSKCLSDFTIYAEAWTYFLVMAKEYDGNVSVLEKCRTPKFGVELFGVTKQSEVVRIDSTSKLLVDFWKVIAVLPLGIDFQGGGKVDVNDFMDNASTVGYAVKMMD